MSERRNVEVCVDMCVEMSEGEGPRVETVVRKKRERELSVRRWLDGRRNCGQVSDTGTGRVLGELEVRYAKLGWGEYERILETGWRGDSIYHGCVPLLSMRSTWTHLDSMENTAGVGGRNAGGFF